MRLDEAAAGVPGLHRLVVFSAEGLLVHQWSRDPGLDGEELAVEYARLFSVGAEIGGRTTALAEPQWLTLEFGEGRLLLGRISAELRIGVWFDRSWPLGLVRAQTRQLLDLARVFEESGGESDAVRALVDEVRRRAPDPEAALSHMARAAGISVLDLARPELLSPDQTQAVLGSVPRFRVPRTHAGLED